MERDDKRMSIRRQTQGHLSGVPEDETTSEEDRKRERERNRFIMNPKQQVRRVMLIK